MAKIETYDVHKQAAELTDWLDNGFSQTLREIVFSRIELELELAYQYGMREQIAKTLSEIRRLRVKEEV